MALVSDKLIFIHIQKTGGMSVRRAMHALDGAVYESGPIEVERHFGLPELLVAHPGIDQGRKVFGFVRHPMSWLYSRWAFAKKSGFTTQMRHRPSAAMLWIASCWSETFEGFVERYLERYPGVATQEMFRRLGLWSDRPAEYIGRTEHLVADLAQIFAYESLPLLAISVDHRDNVTGDKRVPVSSVLADAVAKAERGLIERFYSDDRNEPGAAGAVRTGAEHGTGPVKGRGEAGPVALEPERRIGPVMG